MKFLADSRLYSDTEHCLAMLRALEAPDTAPTPPAKERYHFYWKGIFGRKQAFCLKSFLATQDIAGSEIWLWLDAADGFAGYERNSLLQPLLPYLKVLPFDQEADARGTPIEGRPDLHWERPVKRSNFVRHVVLYKYGGTYADFDIMFLRDLRALRSVPGYQGEFTYQWSSQAYGNSAILRLEQESETARRLLEAAVERGDTDPRTVLRFAGNETLDLLVLPSGFFDPIWLIRDRKDTWAAAPFLRFDTFFRRFGLLHWQAPGISSHQDFFPGAFAYHWHNLWTAWEHRRSYYGLFEREFDAIVARLPAPAAGPAALA